MRISKILEDFKDKHIIGRGLGVAEREIEEIIQQVRKEESTIEDAMSIHFGDPIAELDNLIKPQASPFNDLNEQVSTNPFGVK